MNITMVNAILKAEGVEYENCFEIVQSFSMNHVIVKLDGAKRIRIKVLANGFFQITEL